MTSNNITVVGNLTRDPELRYTQAGKATCTVGIAVNRRYQLNGEWQEATTFMNVVAWDQLAENIAASLSKGTRVLVSGRLDVREYEAKEGGKRTSVDIVADEVGPTLRWATVSVERTPPKGGGDGGSAPRQAPRGASTAPASNAGNDSQYGDEEPF
ncbi:MAG: single-stranded DNA-binding protein [Ilumatobacteraceae bacterium]|jgi:single-strand DNA-binding protein|nr:single-stranded DNA-binding protein [Ilumatobacteraceae bacterium]